MLTLRFWREDEKRADDEGEAEGYVRASEDERKNNPNNISYYI
jgi:hypothetical protein